MNGMSVFRFLLFYRWYYAMIKYCMTVRNNILLCRCEGGHKSIQNTIRREIGYGFL